MPTDSTKIPRLHLGITMAGAASAGCYTGGAMDYLFEILDLWQKAKDKKLPLEWGTEIYNYVPPHEVIIDAMGGTSAGGMTTIMATIYALKGHINPVTDPAEKNKKKDNLLYDSWVLMGDMENVAGVLERTLIVDDLNNSGKIQSLLNSDFIDSICEDAFKDDKADKKKPSYISNELEVVLSHTMLRSVPLAVNFTTPFGELRDSSDNPEHNTFDHFTISHFKLDYNDNEHKNKYLPLQPFDSTAAVAMKLATKATGAFPVGLKFREFFSNELPTEYIQNTSEKIIFNIADKREGPETRKIKWPANFPKPFDFVSIDGGAINNEPFGEVLNILKQRHGIKKPGDYHSYALIMIDPFPDTAPFSKYKQPGDLFSVVPAIIGTLWDQAKVKKAEMLDAYSNEYYRGEIFPKRYTKKTKLEGGEEKTVYEKEDYAIACGSAMAFGGFLDVDFRHHDFFLGRDNARNFFKVYFSFEYDPVNNNIHPIHKSWTEDMIGKFKFKREGKYFLPIIPDMYLLQNKLKGKPNNPFEHVVAQWPQYDAEKLFALTDKMKKRISRMLDLTYDKLTNTKDAAEAPVTHELLQKENSGWLKLIARKIGSALLRFVFNIAKGKLANRMTKAAMQWILKDLEKRGLLKKA